MLLASSWLTLFTARDDPLRVTGDCQCCDCLVVCVLDHVQQLATLGPECSDLAVTPATDDGLAVLQVSNEASICMMHT